jgi:hypothetical protein
MAFLLSRAPPELRYIFDIYFTGSKVVGAMLSCVSIFAFFFQFTMRARVSTNVLTHLKWRQ